MTASPQDASRPRSSRLLEEHLRPALIISHGDLSIFINRPISAILLALAGLVLVLTVVPTLYRLREEAFHDS